MLKFFKQKIVLILLLASALRLLGLDKIPPSLNWDEVSMGYTAYSIGKTGMDEWGERLPLFFRSYGEWKSPVYIYLLVPLVKFFGMNPWTVRLPSALAGILAVYLTYLIGRKIYTEKVGLWAALLLSISPWHLVLSRPGFEANVSLTLVLAGIYFFLNVHEHTTQLRIRYVVCAAIAFGLAPHTYNSAKVIVPFLVLYLVWQTKFYKNIKQMVIFGSVLLLFAIPIVINLFSGRAQFRYSQVGVSTDQLALNQFVTLRKNPHVPNLVGKLLFNKYTYSLHAVLDNGLSYLNPAFLLVEAGDHTQHHVPYFGVLYVGEFIFLVYGLSILKKNSQHAERLLPLVLIVLGIVPAALTRDEGHVLRSILTLPGWQLLAALGIEYVRSKSSRWYKSLLVLLCAQAVFFLAAYFFWYPTTYARDWQYGLKEVAAYVNEHESEYDQIIVSKWFGEAQLFLAFYNHWDPAWYIEANKPNLVYEKQGKLWLDQLDEYSIGKYTFKYIHYSEEIKSSKILFIGKFDDFYENPKTLKTIDYPDDSVAIHIMGGESK